MNNPDREYLESLYVGFAMIGFLMKGTPTEEIPFLSKTLAKSMLEDEAIGILSIKPKRQKRNERFL